MYIAAVSKALPKHHFGQPELTALLESVWQGRLPSANRIKRFHDAVGVRSRHLALSKEEYEQLENFTDANNAYIEVGSELGAQAVTDCLEQANLKPSDVDAIFFTTVTGLAVPTIDARLVNRLGLRRDIKRTPLFGLGCLAGAAGIARMHDYLQAYPNHVAVLLSVELCSLTLQLKDLSVANLIGTGLFGDGASAVVGLGRDYRRDDRRDERRDQAAPPPGRPEVIASKSAFYYDSERVMGWDIGSDGFKLVLSDSVSKFVSRHLRQDVDAFLAEQGLEHRDIQTWVCHPGGPKILTALGEALDLTPDELALTWQSLEKVGNLSSSSVLFVLADTIACRPGRPGSYGVMLAMGPGFCSELVLLRW